MSDVLLRCCSLFSQIEAEARLGHRHVDYASDLRHHAGAEEADKRALECARTIHRISGEAEELLSTTPDTSNTADLLEIIGKVCTIEDLQEIITEKCTVRAKGELVQCPVCLQVWSVRMAMQSASPTYLHKLGCIVASPLVVEVIKQARRRAYERFQRGEE